MVGDALAVEKYVAAGPDDVSIIAQVSSKEQLLTSVRLMLLLTAKALLEQAWGPGLVAKDAINRPMTVWLDEASGWRAIWEDETGDMGSLEFTNYLSLPALIGAGPGDFAVFTTPVLGATEDELTKAYPGLYDAKDDFAAAADRVGLDVDARQRRLRRGWQGELGAFRRPPTRATRRPRSRSSPRSRRASASPRRANSTVARCSLYRATAPKVVVEDETITRRVEDQLRRALKKKTQMSEHLLVAAADAQLGSVRGCRTGPRKSKWNSPGSSCGISPRRPMPALPGCSLEIGGARAGAADVDRRKIHAPSA